MGLIVGPLIPYPYKSRVGVGGRGNYHPREQLHYKLLLPEVRMEGGGSGQPLQLKLVSPDCSFRMVPGPLRAVQSVSRIGRGGAILSTLGP
jgi:hypothetical protein